MNWSIYIRIIPMGMVRAAGGLEKKLLQIIEKRIPYDKK
jgi:hypothetical protein